MRHKSFELIETKADGAPGEFTAIVAAFGNVDRGGDRIVMGAFTKTIENWQKSGDPFPIILSHQWNDVMAHIGVADPKDMQQVKKGLKLKGKLDVEDNPVAAQVYKLMKRRSLKEFSIGYSVPAGGEALTDDGVNELLTIDLVEAGPTLKGMNPATELLGVKAAIVEELNPPEPRSEEVLRREAAGLERAEQEATLPDIVVETGPDPEQVAAREAEAARQDAEVKAARRRLEQAAEILDPSGPSERALRRASDALERSETLPHLVEGTTEPEEAEELTPEPEPVPEPPSESVLRAASEKLRRAAAQQQLADIRDVAPEPPAPEPEPEPEPEPAPEPAPEKVLRQASEQLRRAAASEILEGVRDVPQDPEPTPEVEAAPEPPPAPERELRRRSEQLRRASQSEQLVEGVVQDPPAPAPAPPTPAPPPPPEEDLRRRSAGLERERVKKQLPKVEAEPAPDPVAVMAESVSKLTDQLKAMQERIEELQQPAPPSTAELRRASDALERAEITEQLPVTTVEPSLSPEQEARAEADAAKSELARMRVYHSVGKAYSRKRLASDIRMQLDAAGTARFGGATNTYVCLDDFDPDQGWAVYCVYAEGAPAQFYRVDYTTEADGSVTLASDSVEVVRTTTYRPLNQPKADTPVKPVDPLRRRSEQTVLEIQSDGASLRKYQEPAAKEPTTEPLSEAALRKASRAAMLETLTGGTA